MDSVVIGFLLVFGIVHLLLIAVPLGTTLRAPLSISGKLAWSAFLILLPSVGQPTSLSTATTRPISCSWQKPTMGNCGCKNGYGMAKSGKRVSQ